MDQSAWTPVTEAPAAPAGWTPVAQPDFKATNKPGLVDGAMDAIGQAWDVANTPLVPQIAEAAHAIAAHMDAPKLDQSETLAQIKGFLAGATDATGSLVSGFTSPIGIAMTLAGMGEGGAIASRVPAIKSLLSLPAVKSLQRAVQAASGAAFTAHGAGRVYSAPDAAGKLQGAVEMAAGAAGVRGAMRGAAPAIPTNLSPAEEASNVFAQQHDIPLDAATATGSRTMRAMQKRVANSIGGEGTAERMIGAQQEALARVGGELADQAHPSPVQPVQAGEGVRDAIAQQAQDHATAANGHYDIIRQAEDANPARFSVDITREKAALKPLYERLARESELVPGSVMGDKARVLNALDRFMRGPDTTRLTVLDEVVSDLRSLSGANNSNLLAEARSAGQGAAAMMVKQLDAKVKATARSAGPAIINALEDGRAATAAKYEAINAGDLLADEPRGIFAQLTTARDGGLNKLRAVANIAPNQLPRVGRAVLEDLIGQATERGRFDHADKLFAQWQKLGSETKKLLFPSPGQRQALDGFFLLAKRLAENPNPSGTAHVNNVFNWFSTIGTYPLAKLLYTPGGVRAVSRLMSAAPSVPTMAISQTAAQRAGWIGVAAAARAAGVQTPVPLAASTTPSTEQP